MRGPLALAVIAALGAVLPAACSEARPDLALRASAGDPPRQVSTVKECGACHMAHREQLPDKSFEIK